MRFRVLRLLHRLCPALGLAAGLGLVVEVTPTTPAAAASAGVPRFEPAPDGTVCQADRQPFDPDFGQPLSVNPFRRGR